MLIIIFFFCAGLQKALLQQYQESYQKINYLKFSFQSQKKLSYQEIESPLKERSEGYFHQKKENLYLSPPTQLNPQKVFHSSVFLLSNISEQEKQKRTKIRARYLYEQQTEQAAETQQPSPHLQAAFEDQYYLPPMKHQQLNPKIMPAPVLTNQMQPSIDYLFRQAPQPLPMNYYYVPNYPFFY